MREREREKERKREREKERKREREKERKREREKERKREREREKYAAHACTMTCYAVPVARPLTTAYVTTVQSLENCLK